MSQVSIDDVRAVVLGQLEVALGARGLKSQDVPDDFDLLTEGVIDSLGIVTLITAVEQHFAIQIDFEELAPEQLTVIGPFCRYVAAKSQGNGDGANRSVTPEKAASTDYPIHDLLADRWSPYAFADRPVPPADLLSLFEAARWAPSSYNEQPWSYIVASKEDPDQFRRMLSCLIEWNQAWAKTAPVLTLCVVSLRFRSTGLPNRAAVHDIGLAYANLVVEATTRGLSVHQMIGIIPDKARETYAIPEGHQAWTAMALGYLGNPASLPDPFRERDLTPRRRKLLHEFVFSGKWGTPTSLALERKNPAA